MRLTCTDHRIIEILGLRPSNRLPVSYYDGRTEVTKSVYSLYSLQVAHIDNNSQMSKYN